MRKKVEFGALIILAVFSFVSVVWNLYCLVYRLIINNYIDAVPAGLISMVFALMLYTSIKAILKMKRKDKEVKIR